MTNISRYRSSSLLHQLHRLSQEWDQLFEPSYPDDNSFYRRFALPDTA